MQVYKRLPHMGHAEETAVFVHTCPHLEHCKEISHVSLASPTGASSESINLVLTTFTPSNFPHCGHSFVNVGIADTFWSDLIDSCRCPRNLLSSPPAETKRLKAKLIYTGIRVKDLDRSVEFYTRLLGMKETGRTKVDMTKGETVGLVSEDGGHLLELNYYGKGSDFDIKYGVGEALDHLAFQVEDLEKALAEAKKAGYPVVLDMKTKNSRWTYIKDPNGIYVELFGK